jgi:hypothetical protein
MTNQHPITPPPELIEDWIEIAKPLPQRPPNPGELATLAARWGADQELKACCKWLPKLPPWSGNDLRKHRRPKPPSLKEQALEALKALPTPAGQVTADRLDTIRRALEALPE